MCWSQGEIWIFAKLNTRTIKRKYRKMKYEIMDKGQLMDNHWKFKWISKGSVILRFVIIFSNIFVKNKMFYDCLGRFWKNKNYWKHFGKFKQSLEFVISYRKPLGNLKEVSSFQVSKPRLFLIINWFILYSEIIFSHIHTFSENPRVTWAPGAWARVPAHRFGPLAELPSLTSIRP